MSVNARYRKSKICDYYTISFGAISNADKKNTLQNYTYIMLRYQFSIFTNVVTYYFDGACLTDCQMSRF